MDDHYKMKLSLRADNRLRTSGYPGAFKPAGNAAHLQNSSGKGERMEFLRSTLVGRLCRKASLSSNMVDRQMYTYT